jgi:membrane-associated phospholipid phosphatase
MKSSEARRLAGRWLPHIGAAIVLSALLVWDRQLFGAVDGFRSPFLDWLTDRVAQLRGATFPAALSVLMIAIGLVGRWRQIRRAGTAMLLTVLLAGAVTSAMKEIIDRPGPDPDAVVAGESWFDAHYGRFPSSHSAITFGAASALSSFVPGAAMPGFALAVLVSYERVYRGTHFPSDIFAGIWIGLVTARFVVAQLARRGWQDEPVPAPPENPSNDSILYGWVYKKRDRARSAAQPLPVRAPRATGDTDHARGSGDRDREAP